MKAIFSSVMIGAALAFCGVSAGAQAQPKQQAADRPVNFDIRSQKLTNALNEWADQTQLQFISPAAEVTDRIVAPRVKGTFTAQAALNLLLANTPLTYQFLSDRMVSIRPRSEEGVAAVSPRRQPKPVAKDDRRDSQQVAMVEEMTVVGSRLKRYTEEGPAPVIIFDRERIERLGVTNIADVLDYLQQQSFAAREQTNFGGARVARLRGLGEGTTLILLNGRRTVTSALQGGRGFFDLNAIPLAAVERIEVLSDSASAIYGADAVGGVVNVVLKTEVDPAVDIYYGVADGGADERRASLTLAHSGERLRVSAIVDYFDRGALLGAERSITANQDFRRFGGTDTRAVTTNPANISSTTAANLPGLPSTSATVPAGSTGIGLTPADFLATAGQTNRESLFRYFSPVPETDRRSAAAFGEFDLTNNIAAFGELQYANRDDTRRNVPPTLSNRTVPASNAFNPFGVPVLVDYLFTGIGPTETVAEAESYRSVVGLKGQMGSWDWEFAVLSGEEDGSTFVANQVDATAVAAALASSDPAQALNVFQDGPGGSPTLLASLVAAPIVNEYSSSALQGSAFVRGDIFSIPGGPVSAIVGAEARKEKIHFEAKPTLTMSADRNTSSVYSEVQAPLTNPDMQLRWLRRVVLTMAGRYDDYDDFGGTFNPQFGLQWEPVQHLLLRGSYGTSFRAPLLFHLYQPERIAPFQTLDPRRGGERVLVSGRFAGNPNLDPEESTSKIFGFVLTPGGADALRFEASWWSIEQDQRVQSLSVPQLLAAEDFFQDRIVRAPPSAADIAAGRPGSLVSVDLSSLNYGRLETSGIDVQISRSIPFSSGRLMPTLLATWADKFRVIDLLGTPFADRVAVASFLQTIPRWRAVVTLEWSTNLGSLTATARYVASYDDTTSGLRNGRTVDARTLIDVDGSVHVGRLFDNRSWWLDGLEIRAGIKNLFDDEPPFSDVAGQGYDSSLADLRQRFGYVTISKTF